MKIIFLDIDGVLATSDTYSEAGSGLDDHALISKDCINALNKLVEQTDAKVVITSAWRYGRDTEYFQLLLSDRGFVGEVIDMTPKWNQYKDNIGIKTTGDLDFFWQHERGNEINMWLRNKNKIKSFIIIDDESSDIYPLFPNHLLVTSMEQGFGKEHVNEAIKILEISYGR